jgi:hypothetical protein
MLETEHHRNATAVSNAYAILESQRKKITHDSLRLGRSYLCSLWLALINSAIPQPHQDLAASSHSFARGSEAACVINSIASISFSSSYRLPTSCKEIGASTYLLGSSTTWSAFLSSITLSILARLTKLVVVLVVIVSWLVPFFDRIFRATLQARWED